MLRLYDIDTGDGPGLLAVLSAPDAPVESLKVTKPAADTLLFATPEGWRPGPYGFPAQEDATVGPWLKALVIPPEIAMHLEPGAPLTLTLTLADGSEQRMDLPVSVSHPLWTGAEDLPEPDAEDVPPPPSDMLDADNRFEFVASPRVEGEETPSGTGTPATPPDSSAPGDPVPTHAAPDAPPRKRSRLPLLLAACVLLALLLTYLHTPHSARPVARDDGLHLDADEQSASLQLFANDTLPLDAALLGCEGPPISTEVDGLITLSRDVLSPGTATRWTCRIAPGGSAVTITSTLTATVAAPAPAPDQPAEPTPPKQTQEPATRPPRVADAEACRQQSYPEAPLPDGTNPPIACDDAIFLQARGAGTHLIQPLLNDLDDGPENAMTLQDCQFPEQAVGLTITDTRAITLTDDQPDRRVPLALRFTCTIRDRDGLTDRALVRIILEPRDRTAPRPIPQATRAPAAEQGQRP